MVKAALSSRDNWRVDLKNLSFGNVWGINPDCVTRTDHPVLHGLVTEFAKCRMLYYKGNCNFRHDYVLNNPMFRLGPNTVNYLSPNGMEIGLDLDELYFLSRLSFLDFFEGNRVKPYLNLCREFGVNLGHDIYLVIRNMLIYNRRLNARFIDEDMNTISMGADITRVKKHGKKLRVILRQSDRKRGSKLENLTTVKSFF